MAISYISNALGEANSTTSFSITLPTTQANDILILEYTHRGTPDATLGGTSITTGGLTWTEKHDQLYATSTFSGKTVWTRATGNHSGQTITGTGLTNSCAAIVTVYRGALTSADPLADATIVGEQNAAANETQAQITTATNGAYVVLVVANSPDVAVTSQACTSPGALTARAERLSTGGTDTSIAHASAEKATAGATGAFTWAQTDGASGSWAYAITPEPPTYSQTAAGFYADGTESGSTLIDDEQGTVATYYFNASDAGPTDPNAQWTNDANAFDGSTATGASTSITTGSASTNYLKGEGTTAPTTGDPITNVRARFYAILGGGTTTAEIYTNAQAQLLGSPSNTGGAGVYTSYVTLSTPSGGWTWQKVNDLEVLIYKNGGAGLTASVAVVEVEVTSVPAQLNIIRDVSAGDSNLQLRTRIQNSNSIIGLSTDDYQLQYELNDSGTYYDVNTNPTVDSYNESNRNTNSVVGNNSAFDFEAIGQSFTGLGVTLSQARFSLAKTGSPTGNAVAKIYAHTGTFGTSSLPTGAALATSDNFDVSTLTGSFAVYTLTFSGANQIALVNGTNYVVVFEYANGNSSNYAQVGVDDTSSTHPGNGTTFRGGGIGWGSQTFDAIFYIIGSSPVLNFNSASLTDGNATTNRLGAGTGSFVAGKISEDGLVDDLQITASNYTELLYSLTIESTAVADNDTLDFRVLRNSATTGMTYTITPRVTIEATPADAHIIATQDIANSLSIDATTISQNHIISPNDIALSLTTDNTSVALPIDLLTDNFNDNSLDAAKWTKTETGGTSTEQNQRTELFAPADGNFGYANIRSVNLYSLQNSSAKAEVNIDLSAGTNNVFSFDIFHSGGRQVMWAKPSGTSNLAAIMYNPDFTELYSVAYNATTHKWLRISEVSGTIYWYTSSDGTNWTERATASVGAFDISQLRMLIEAYANGATNDGITVHVDNFNVEPSTVIVPADATIGTTIDTTTISQNHVIAIQDEALAVTIDNATIAQNHVIQTQDIGIGLTEDNTTISETHNVVPADVAVALTEDNTSISQTHIVTPQDTAIALSEDNTTISQNQIIASNDIGISLTEDNTTVSQTHAITGQDIAIALTTDNTSISQVHSVTSQDIALALTEDATTINQNHIVTPADVAIALTEDNTTVNESSLVISPNDVGVTLTEDATTISQIHSIAGADVAISTATDNTTISQNHVVTPQDAALSLTADNASITQNHILIANDVLVSTTEDNTSVTQIHNLIAQDILHSLTLDATTVDSVATLQPNDIAINLTIDSTSLAGSTDTSKNLLLLGVG